jgi:hypothetical protein
MTGSMAFDASQSQKWGIPLCQMTGKSSFSATQESSLHCKRPWGIKNWDIIQRQTKEEDPRKTWNQLIMYKSFDNSPQQSQLKMKKLSNPTTFGATRFSINSFEKNQRRIKPRRSIQASSKWFVAQQQQVQIMKTKPSQQHAPNSSTKKMLAWPNATLYINLRNKVPSHYFCIGTTQALFVGNSYFPTRAPQATLHLRFPQTRVQFGWLPKTSPYLPPPSSQRAKEIIRWDKSFTQTISSCSCQF